MLTEYDRILRRWMLQPSLDLAQLGGQMGHIIESLEKSYLSVSEPHWSPDDHRGDQLRVEVERFNLIERLKGDIELVKLLITNDLNLGLRNNLDDYDKKILNDYLKQKPISHFCKTFHSEIDARKSLLFEDSVINQLKTNLLDFIGESKDTYQPLIQWITEKIEDVIKKRRTLKNWSKQLNEAGENDHKEHGIFENFPAIANEALLSLEQDDTQNSLNWKELISYKNLKDYYEIKEKIRFENELVDRIIKHTKHIERKIARFKKVPEDHQTAIERADYSTAVSLIFDHYFNLEDIEAINLTIVSDIEAIVDKIINLPDLEKLFSKSRVADLLGCIQIIDQYEQNESLLEANSRYIKSLLLKLSEKRQELIVIKIEIDALLSELVEKQEQWKSESDQLEVLENDYFNIKWYHPKRRRVEIVNRIIEALDNLDVIAPENNFTKEKRQQWY